MCAAKSPISILQEHSMAKSNPLPHYDIVSQGTGFLCRGVVGNIVETAVAQSKKQAKHLCAERILNKLGLLKSNASCVILHERYLENVPNLLNKSENYVGMLNELCSKCGKEYPTYNEAGCLNSKFRIECQLDPYVGLGEGPTKKQAKQDAAKKVMNRIEIEGWHFTTKKHLTVTVTSETLRTNLELDNEVIEYFKTLSLEKKTQIETEKNPLTFIIENANQKTEVENKTPEPDLRTEKDLQQELQMMGIRYTLVEMESNCDSVGFLLKTQPSSSLSAHSFIHFNESFETALIGVLRKAVDGIAFLKKEKKSLT